MHDGGRLTWFYRCHSTDENVLLFNNAAGITIIIIIIIIIALFIMVIVISIIGDRCENLLAGWP